MRRTLLALAACLFLSCRSHAGPGAVRCGKLLNEASRQSPARFYPYVHIPLLCSQAVAAFTCDNAAATSFKSGTTGIS